jgi:23S rRNA pseudouridine1911/1915/1917 synthase
MEVLYEDNHLIAVYKSAGVLVQGDKTGDKCLMDEVKEYLKKKYNKPGNVFLGLLHRLDRPVSGIILFAKTSKGTSRLSEQFRNHSVKKIYHAMVENAPKQKSGTLVHYLKKDEKKNFVTVFNEPTGGALKAELDYEIINKRVRPKGLRRNGDESRQRSKAERPSPNNEGLSPPFLTTGDFALLKVSLKTGRPHQIRAQLAHIGCPIVGDVKYGSRVKYKNGEIALCATELGFETATTKEKKNIKLDSLPLAGGGSGGGLANNRPTRPHPRPLLRGEGKL